MPELRREEADMRHADLIRSVALAALAPLAAFLLSACATSEPYRPIVDSAVRVIGPGFSVLPPSGSNWVVSKDSSLDAISFGKANPEHFKQGGSVIAVASLVSAGNQGIASPEGLRSAVEGYVRRHLSTYTIVSVSVEPYRDRQRNTDCARIETVSEERGNPRYPGKVLLMTVTGKACRHPLALDRFVQVTYSERRPVGTPPLIDDALRRECETTLDSLEFLPIDRS
jgi:hypothetical protein